MRIAVLASGGGSNLQALIEASRDDPLVDIGLVASNRSGAGALVRAERAGIPRAVLADPGDADALLSLWDRHRIDLVVLAGYLTLVPPAAVAARARGIINIHPALLPAFGGAGMYGIRVHRAVLAAGVTVTGATVHVVDAEYDHGPVIAQWPVPVAPDDTPESLQQRVLAVEHQLLPAVVRAAARAGRVVQLAPRDRAFQASRTPVALADVLVPVVS